MKPTTKQCLHCGQYYIDLFICTIPQVTMLDYILQNDKLMEIYGITPDEELCHHCSHLTDAGRQIQIQFN